MDASFTETSRPEVAASRKRVAPSSGSGAADTAIAAYGLGRKQAREKPASPSLDPLIAAGGRDESGAALAKLIEMNFYDALGAQPCATNAEIRRAFRAVALKYHPDKGGDPRIFHYLSTVRDILLNKAKREQYDFHGRAPFAEAFSKKPPGGDGEADTNGLPGQRILFAPISEMLEKMAGDEAWATQL